MLLKRKMVSLGMIVALLLALLPVCMAAPKKKIVIWEWSPEQTKFFQEMEAAMEKKFPDIDVQYVTIAQAQYINSLPLAFRGDNAPDIFFHQNSTPADLVSQGFVRPLDDLMTASFKNQFPNEYFYEGVCKIDGKTYALPQSNYKIARPDYFFYNKDVMKKAGLNPNRPPRTWSEFRQMAKKVTQAGKGEFYGIAMVGKPAQDLQRELYPLAHTLGINDNFFDYHTGKWGYDDPRWVELYNFVKDLKDDGSFFPGFASMDKTLARTYFAQNKAAFYLDGLWLPGNLTAMGYSNLNYGVAPAPVPDKGRKGYAYQIPTLVPMWYMSSQTKYPKDAWKVMSFFYSQEYQQGFVANNFGYSPLKKFNNTKYIQDPILKQIIKIAPQVSRLGIIPTIRNPKAGLVKIFTTVDTVHPTVWEIMTTNLLGQGDLKADLGELNRKLNEITDQQVKEAKLSKEDLIFKNWDPLKDFTLDMYK